MTDTAAGMSSVRPSHTPDHMIMRLGVQSLMRLGGQFPNEIGGQFPNEIGWSVPFLTTTSIRASHIKLHGTHAQSGHQSQ